MSVCKLPGGTSEGFYLVGLVLTCPGCGIGAWEHCSHGFTSPVVVNVSKWSVGSWGYPAGAAAEHEFHQAVCSLGFTLVR